MSTFDITQLENLEVNTSFDTVTIPVPIGDWRAVIKKYEIRMPKDQPLVEVYWCIDEHEVVEETGREEPMVRQTIWLDVTENGLDNGKGKNVQLGKLREALGQNDASKPWGFGNLLGCVAVVKVVHTAGKDDGTIEAKVVRVAEID